jgi:hypothetical protein
MSGTTCLEQHQSNTSKRTLQMISVGQISAEFLLLWATLRQSCPGMSSSWVLTNRVSGYCPLQVGSNFYVKLQLYDKFCSECSQRCDSGRYMFATTLFLIITVLLSTLPIKSPPSTSVGRLGFLRRNAGITSKNGAKLCGNEGLGAYSIKPQVSNLHTSLNNLENLQIVMLVSS